MSTPIIEHIAANIATTVNTITIENGDNQDLVAIRPRRFDFKDVSPKDGIVLILQRDEEESSAEAIQTETWNQLFDLVALVIDSDDAAASIDTRINQVVADIRKKLAVDITRGGYAHNTQFRPAWIIEDEKFTGVVVPIAILYRTVWNDPYTKS